MTVDDREISARISTRPAQDPGQRRRFGGVFDPRLRFYMLGTVVQAVDAGTSSRSSSANLKTDATTNINNGRVTDAYVEFAEATRYATVRAGQYKIPFGLEELTPDTKLRVRRAVDREREVRPAAATSA